MNGLEHNYRLSFELVGQNKYWDLERNAFSIDVEPMLNKYWESTEDGGATLKQHRVSIQC